MIVFSMQISAVAERRTAVLRTLGSMLGPTRVAPGCMDARLYSDLDKRKTLLLVEEWESRPQFEPNLDAAKLNVIVAAIERCSEAPVIRVDSVERDGVDALGLHRSIVCGCSMNAMLNKPCSTLKGVAVNIRADDNSSGPPAIGRKENPPNFPI